MINNHKMKKSQTNQTKNISKKQKKRLKQLQKQQIREKQQMEIQKKKKKKESNLIEDKNKSDDEDNEESNNNNEQDNLNFQQFIQHQDIQNNQVSFLISEINQNQYQSMKVILQKYARLTTINSAELANAIIQNSKLGNVVLVDDDSEEEEEEEEEEDEQIDDEENVCHGVINLLPSKNDLLKKIKDKIIQSYTKFGNNNKTLKQCLQKSEYSLLICQRAINLPAFIGMSMHQVLAKQLKTSIEKMKDNELEQKYGKYILVLSDVEIPKGVTTIDRQTIIFSHFEDYALMQKSQEWWIGQKSVNSLKKANINRLSYLITLQNYIKSSQTLNQLLTQ